jgi:CPA2 family monovalent cation:H+ antiporter-2
MVIVLFLIRYHIVMISVLRLIDIHSPLRWYWNYGLANLAIILIILSRDLKYVSIRLERTFFQNLHRRDMKKELPGYGRMLKGSDLHLTSLTVPENSAWAGKSLASLNIGNKMQVVVAAIVRGRLRINIPDGKNRLFPGDVIEVVGDDESIEKVRTMVQTEPSGTEYLESREPLVLQKLVIAANSTLVGKKLMESGIRDNFHCSVIGVEDKDGDLERVGAQHVFAENEILWILGEYEQVELLRLVTHPEFSMKDGEITFE